MNESEKSTGEIPVAVDEPTAMPHQELNLKWVDFPAQADAEPQRAYELVSRATGVFYTVFPYSVEILKCGDSGGPFWRYSVVVGPNETLRSGAWGPSEKVIRAKAELSLRLLLDLRRLEDWKNQDLDLFNLLSAAH